MNNEYVKDNKCPFDEPLHNHHDGCPSCYSFFMHMSTIYPMPIEKVLERLQNMQIYELYRVIGTARFILGSRRIEELRKKKGVDGK